MGATALNRNGRSVADRIGVSMRQLQRAFLPDGISPRQFIVNARLDEAARKIALCGDREPTRIIDIALDVGFNDVSHFSRTFRRRFGCSPSRFRGQ
ncbi:helix-turn-helix transcriptional regulator [Novosphingobium humi]|uniref:Helix-turn-helix transcriptional regulator n=1 Tax=Novosphingobium humi TaxID=2282397 RepID=A0ABY7U2V2_9SPHN|nr:helix-turn-helix transcriptional regulator [Novosphingobium humi]WCT79440.1 helix-turn-helix transcriptional regulator [Novosphingobium humi]